MVSKAERGRQQIEDAIDRRGQQAVKCVGCGETVGYYRPGRVRQPSLERPVMRLKCTRVGCRMETIRTLDETLTT